MAKLDFNQLDKMIREASARAGVPTNLLAALVRHESGGDPEAVSPAGAIGLTQLMPETARALGVNPHDPWENLLGGAKYLRQQYERFGNWGLALAAYNAGPGAVEKYGGIPPYQETQNYVSNVLRSAGLDPDGFATPAQRGGSRSSLEWYRAHRILPPEGVRTTGPVGFGELRAIESGAPPLKKATPLRTPPLLGSLLKASSASGVPPIVREAQTTPPELRTPAQRRTLALWEALKKPEQAAERLAAAIAAEEMPDATDEEKTKRTVELVMASKGHPELLLQNVPREVAEAYETTQTGAVKPTSPLARLWNWIVRQTSRPGAGIKAMLQQPREESEKLFGPQRAFLEGFLHPERYAGPLIPAEKVPSKLVEALRNYAMIKGLPPERASDEAIRKFVSGASEFAFGVATDPLMYVGVGPVAKTGEKGVEAAMKAAEKLEQVRQVPKRLETVLNDLRRRVSRAVEQTAGKAEVPPRTGNAIADVRVGIKKLEQQAKNVPALQARVQKAWNTAAQLQKKFLQKPPTKPEARAEAVRRILEARREAKSLQQSLVAAEEAAKAHASTSAALQRVLDAQRQILPQLERRLAAPPERYLKFAGAPVVSVEKAAQRLDKALARLQMQPGVREASAALARGFRLLAPRPTAVGSVEELLRMKEFLPQLRQRYLEAHGESLVKGKQAAQKYAEIPENARRIASEAVEAPSRTLEIKQGLPPSVQNAVDRAARIWKADRAELTERLVEAFGEDFAEKLLPNYLPHILVGPYKKRKEFVEALVKDPDTFLGDLYKTAQARATAQLLLSGKRIPGTRPFFMYERTLPTLADLKAFAQQHGLDVIDDVGLINGMYRFAAEKVLHMKDISDWLVREGLIRGFKKVPPEGWKRADTAFPWLKERGELYMHPEVARFFQDSVKPLVQMDAEEMNAIGRAYSHALSLFKGAVTSVRPTFHLINALGNMFLMRMAGISYAKQADAMAEAARVLAGTEPRAQEILAFFQRYGLEGHGMFADTRRLSEHVVQQLQDYMDKHAKGLAGKIKVALLPRTASALEKATGLAATRTFGEATDSFMRLAAFTHFLKEGFRPDQAARLVREYMFDYSQLTPAERAIRRWFVPFYTWARFAAPRSVMAALLQPGAFAGYQHLVDAIDEAEQFNRNVLPPYLRWIIVLGKKDDGQVVFVNPQVPWEPLFTMTSEDRRTGTPEAGREVAGMLSPFLQAGAVFAQGAPIGEKAPETNPYLESPKLERLKTALKQFVPYWEFEKLYPDRPGAPAQAVGRLVAGLKGYPISFLATFDVPLAEARNISDAYENIGKYVEAVQTWLGSEEAVPALEKVESEVKKVKQREAFARVWEEAKTNPYKHRLLGGIIASIRSPQEFVHLLVPNADLFTGTNEEVQEKIAGLFSADNARRLAVYLRRSPTPKDFLEHRKALEDGTLEAVPPEVRRLQSTLKALDELRELGIVAEKGGRK